MIVTLRITIFLLLLASIGTVAMRGLTPTGSGEIDVKTGMIHATKPTTHTISPPPPVHVMRAVPVMSGDIPIDNIRNER